MKSPQITDECTTNEGKQISSANFKGRKELTPSDIHTCIVTVINYNMLL